MMHRPAVEEVVLSRPTGCKSNCGHEVLLDTVLATGRQRAQQVTEVSLTKAQLASHSGSQTPAVAGMVGASSASQWSVLHGDPTDGYVQGNLSDSISNPWQDLSVPESWKF